DLATGNLEGVFSSLGGTPKSCNDPKICYVFRMPDNYVYTIKEAGFDILGTANNHVNDFGPQGRANSARILQEAGMHFAGFNTYPYTIYDTLGLKIAYCAFSPHTGTMNLKDYNGAAELVARLSKECDLVIVGFHGGAEGKDHQHVTREDEVFYGNNRGNVYRFAHTVVDAGADLVIGSGPHVVRAVEFYKGKLIAYSLGNFCTWSRFNLSGPNAYAPALQVWLDRQGNFVKARIHSFYQAGGGGPLPDPGQRAMKKIRDLTRLDFPEDDIVIDDEGWVIAPAPVAGLSNLVHKKP
ncbi:MAG TPA: CapA family protein, partial [Bacteroidales bacterium]|nr:CapA family protein [Bacteroidales bacterium]